MERRYAYNAIAVNPYGFDRPDVDIIKDINLRLRSLDPLDTSLVVIDCSHNIVTLSGTVPSGAVAKFLRNIADRTLGVRAVHSHLIVRRAGASSTPASQDRADEVLVWEQPDAKPIDNDLT